MSCDPSSLLWTEAQGGIEQQSIHWPLPLSTDLSKNVPGLHAECAVTKRHNNPSSPFLNTALRGCWQGRRSRLRVMGRGATRLPRPSKTGCRWPCPDLGTLSASGRSFSFFATHGSAKIEE